MNRMKYNKILFAIEVDRNFGGKCIHPIMPHSIFDKGIDCILYNIIVR